MIEVLDHDQYRIKMDGSGRPSLRNRRFLKSIAPFNSPLQQSFDLAPPQGRDQPLVQTADDNQHLHEEEADHLAEQVLPTNQSTGPSDPVLPRPDPTTPSAPPTQPTSVPAPSPPQQLDDPAVRRSGRDKKLNTRLVGYELGSMSGCVTGISGASRGRGR